MAGQQLNRQSYHKFIDMIFAFLFFFCYELLIPNILALQFES